jgi:hypothetical protein
MAISLAPICFAGLASSPANAKTFYFNNVVYDYTLNSGSVESAFCGTDSSCRLRITGSFDLEGDSTTGLVNFTNVNVKFTQADYVLYTNGQNGAQATDFTYTGGGTLQFDNNKNWTTISFYDATDLTTKGNAIKSDSGVNLTIVGSLSGTSTTSASFVNPANTTSNDNFCNTIDINDLVCTGQKNNLTLLTGSLVDTLPVPSPAIGLGLLPLLSLLRRKSKLSTSSAIRTSATRDAIPSCNA